MKHQKRAGFIIPLIVLFLVLLSMFGIAYLKTAQERGYSIFREADKMKARNLAQAGLEKAMVYIQRKYSFGEYDVSFPSKFVTESFEKEMKRAIDKVGEYRVVAIKPFSYSDGFFSVTDFSNLPYLKNKKVIGRYDIWEITTEGVTERKVSARMTTLLKVIRQEIVY